MQVATVLEFSVIIIVVFNGRRSFAVFHNFPNLMEGMKWYHDLNLHSNSCDDKLISVFLEGGKRTLSKPIIKRDPITPDILNKIIDMYGKDHSNNVSQCLAVSLGNNNIVPTTIYICLS
jgi:hypothetical protein